MKELISDAVTQLIIGLIGTAVMSGCIVAVGAMALFAMSY
jgi:hypothetical protein